MVSLDLLQVSFKGALSPGECRQLKQLLQEGEAALVGGGGLLRENAAWISTYRIT